MKQLPTRVSEQLDADLALRGYTKDPDWMGKTGLGGTIVAAAVLVAAGDLNHFMFFPLTIALSALTTGFVLRTIRMRLRDPQARLAEWNKWVELLMTGLTWLAIQFCWIIAAAGFVTVGSMLAYMAVQKGAPAFLIYELLFISIFTVLFWVTLFSSYLMVNFALEEKLSAGFAVRKVLRTIRKNPSTVTIAWALSCAIQVIATIGTSITLIGLFLLPSVAFASQLIGTTILAQAWRATWPEELPP